MFNEVFPFVLQQLVQGGGRTVEVKSIFDAVRIVSSTVFFPCCGVLSDRFGRKPVLYGILIASVLSGTSLGLSSHFLSWPLYIIAKIFSYLSSPYLLIGMAIIADSKKKSNFASHFGIVGASYGGGMLIGPQIMKQLSPYGWYWPYVCCTGVLVFNFFYVLLVLPKDQPSAGTGIPSRASVLESLKALYTKVSGNTVLLIVLLICVF